MHGHDDGFLAALNGRDAILEGVDVATQMEGFAGWVGLTVVRGEEALAGGFDVQSGGEGFRAGAGENNGSDGWRVGKMIEDCLEFEPHSFLVLVSFGVFMGLGLG